MGAHEKLQLQRHLHLGAVGGDEVQDVGKGVVGDLLGAGDLLQLGGVFEETKTVDHGGGAALQFNAFKGGLEALHLGVGQGCLLKENRLDPVILEDGGHVGQVVAVGHDYLELGGVYLGACVLNVAEIRQQEGFFGKHHHIAVGVVQTRQVALVDLGGNDDSLGLCGLHGGLQLGKVGHGMVSPF